MLRSPPTGTPVAFAALAGRAKINPTCTAADLAWLDDVNPETVKAMDIIIQRNHKHLRRGGIGSELSQPLAHGLRLWGAAPNTALGTRGLVYYILTNITIFGRPRGAEPYSATHLREQPIQAA